MTTKKTKGTSCYYDDDIVCDILSRLPLKSLMRFKCVCKSWQSLIESNQWLIDLHHSKTTPRLLMFLLPRRGESLRDFNIFGSYWTANLCTDTNKDIPTIIQAAISNKDLLACKQVLKPINGMICLIDKQERHDWEGTVKEDHAACLYNVITREATPWMRSNYLEQVGQRVELSQVSVYRTYEFGFDPRTKDKLICMWRIFGKHLQRFEGYGEYTSFEDRNIGQRGEYRMCEILTLGNNTAWRRIDKVPPYKHPAVNHGSVYANGSIYWTSYEDHHPCILVAFDVGREKYRVISGLDLIRPDEPFHLMELDGHLAIKKSAGGGGHTVHLWILDDDCVDKSTSTRSTSSNIKWTKQIIKLPLWWSYKNIRFHVLAGTDYLILECCYDSGRYYHAGLRLPPAFSAVPVYIYSYHRKDKTVSKIKFLGDGSLSSSFGACHGHPLYIFTTYAESLLTFQMSYRRATEAPESSSCQE